MGRKVTRRGPGKTLHLLPELRGKATAVALITGNMAHLLTVWEYKKEVLGILNTKVDEINERHRSNGKDFRLRQAVEGRSNLCGSSAHGDPWTSKHGFVAMHGDANLGGEELVAERDRRI
jgi:hypothetical protein